MEVTQNSVGALTIAFLAVVGLGLTAATISTTYSADLAPGAGQGTDGGQDPGGGGSGQADSQNNTDQQDFEGGSNNTLEIPRICIPLLTQTPVILAMVLGFAAAVGLSYRQFGFVGASFSVYLLGIPMTLLYGVVTQCPEAGGSSGSVVMQALRDAPVGGGLQSSPVPPVVLAGVFLVALVGAVAALVSATGSETVEPPEDEEEEDPELSEFASAAGAAADRIEAAQASVDNAVYRAWREMTDLLSIDDPETSTAGEFADAAVDAGMAREDVEQLTTLFEEVRYGGMDPEPREELALETLRTIEETYGGTETGVDGEAGGELGTDSGSGSGSDAAPGDERDDPGDGEDDGAGGDGR